MRPLAFVDLETTGATAATDHITEIGIVEVDEDGAVREWQQLVNPGTRIPPFIEQLTGISNEMVANAPPFAEVAAEALRRLEGRLFIAHNARFDYGFLKQEFKRLGIDFRASVVCTVKLSRALYPEHHRHNLDTLIERHGLIAADRHRALADAQLIHQFWQKIHVDRKSEAIAAALDKQQARPALPPNLEGTTLDDLPDGPGVYLFYGENNLPIYIGKAKALRKRVLQHFSADLRSAKEMALVQQVRRIDWQETAGELGALLLEAKLVKEELPTQNRQLRKNDELCTWTLIDEGQGWLRPQLTLAQDIDFALSTACYGLFKSSKEANTAMRQLIESHKLCDMLTGMQPLKSGKPCFGQQIRRCKGACIGHEPLAKHSMRLMAALTGLKLTSWPFPGPALIREGDEAHLLNCWRYLGTIRSDDEIAECLAQPQPPFDRDIFKILSKEVARMLPLPPTARLSPENP